MENETMKYTNEQRQAIADVFKKVHNKMKRNPPWGNKNNSRFICDNIAGVACDNTDKHLAGQVITQRLGDRLTVTSWLRDEGHISTDFVVEVCWGDREAFARKQMHAYRLRWLKALIAEFSTEEKQA
jgi:hypothetical protein